jgi:capsule polysaccharide export protein KpsE/RkpR
MKLIRMNFNQLKVYLSKFFKARPVLAPLIATISVFFIYQVLFLTPKYQSEFVLELNSESSNSAALDFDFFSAGPLSSGTSSNDLYKLKVFLESKNASAKFQEIIDIQKFYGRWSIDPFSRYKPSIASFHDYFTDNIINVDVLSDSSTLKVSTTAYRADDALQASLATLLIIDNFFSEKVKLNSEIKKLNKECELGIIQNTLFNTSFINKGAVSITSVPIEQFSTGYDLLRYLAQEAAKFCSSDENQIINSEGDLSNNPPQKINLPANLIRELNLSTLKEAISVYYQDSLNELKNSTYISIVTEPLLPSDTESKNIILNTIIVFVISLLALLTIRILIRVRRDFYEI